MPKNKSLKHRVRTRMKKTGERYTTAHAHVLNNRPEPDDELRLNPAFELVVKRGYLVFGESEADAGDERLEAWRDAHPEFVGWDREWFQHFIDAGTYVADNSDVCGGGDVMLFTSIEAAETYGKRDAAICAGVGRIDPTLWVRIGPAAVFLGAYGNDDDLMDWHRTLWEFAEGFLAEGDVLLFEDSARGRSAVEELAAEIRRGPA